VEDLGRDGGGEFDEGLEGGAEGVAADELFGGIGAGSGDAGADLVGEPLDGAGEGDGAFGDVGTAAGGSGEGVDGGEVDGVENGELELGLMLLGDDVLAVGGLDEIGGELGAVDLEDEVGVGGRVDELKVAPLLEGGVELVIAGVGAAGNLAVEVVVAAGIGEEDRFGGGDARDDLGRCGLLRRGGLGWGRGEQLRLAGMGEGTENKREADGKQRCEGASAGRIREARAANQDELREIAAGANLI